MASGTPEKLAGAASLRGARLGFQCGHGGFLGAYQPPELPGCVFHHPGGRGVGLIPATGRPAAAQLEIKLPWHRSLSEGQRDGLPVQGESTCAGAD